MADKPARPGEGGKPQGKPPEGGSRFVLDDDAGITVGGVPIGEYARKAKKAQEGQAPKAGERPSLSSSGGETSRSSTGDETSPRPA